MIDIKSYSWDILSITNNYSTHLIEKGSADVKIAIIDSGVDIKVPGLYKNINLEKNFVTEETFEDHSGHGTAIAGQIVGNGIIKGIAPDCYLDILKILNKDNTTSFSRLIESLEYIYEQNYDLVNISLGVPIQNLKKDDLKYALNLMEKIREKGTICVCTCGYEITPNSHFPSISKNVISVQSLSRKNAIVNNEIFADYCIPSGNYNDIKLNEENTKHEFVSVYHPLQLSLNLHYKYPEFLELPIGYTFSVGESIAAAKITGIIAIILSYFKKKYGTSPSIAKVLNILNDNSIYIQKRRYPILKNILDNI